MLLHSPAPRHWLALVGICALSLALGSGQVSSTPATRVEEKPTSAPPAGKAEPQKSRPAQAEDEETPKKAPKKAPVQEEDEDEMPALPGFGGAEMRDFQRQMQRMHQEMMRQMQQMARPGGFGIGAADEDRSRRQTRLGVRMERPSEVLADQLDLPRDQGQVVREVQPDSAAARAGIKRHDVLLEVGGKAVPSDADSFRTLVNGIKANEAVDVVVLRKGKREVLKGLTLPRAPARRAQPANPGFGLPQMGLQMQLFPGGWAQPPGGKTVMTTTFRDQDRFTTRHQEGSLVITVTGKVADGKAKVSEINVQDGTEKHSYDSVDKVPERYRDKVNNLIEMSGKGAVRVEIKEP